MAEKFTIHKAKILNGWHLCHDVHGHLISLGVTKTRWGAKRKLAKHLGKDWHLIEMWEDTATHDLEVKYLRYGGRMRRIV
jgi:hypothetical protein